MCALKLGIQLNAMGKRWTKMDEEQEKPQDCKAISIFFFFPEHPHEDSSFWQECSWRKIKLQEGFDGVCLFFNEKKAALYVDY